MIIMDHEYIARKIHMCKELVDNATSEAQKEIYQGYLEFWQHKHKNIIINQRIESKDEVESIIEDLTEVQKAAEFELKYAPKKAYYNRDGKTHETKAFKEFLISKQ